MRVLRTVGMGIAVVKIDCNARERIALHAVIAEIGLAVCRFDQLVDRAVVNIISRTGKL